MCWESLPEKPQCAYLFVHRGEQACKQPLLQLSSLVESLKGFYIYKTALWGSFKYICGLNVWQV